MKFIKNHVDLFAGVGIFIIALGIQLRFGMMIGSISYIAMSLTHTIFIVERHERYLNALNKVLAVHHKTLLIQTDLIQQINRTLGKYDEMLHPQVLVPTDRPRSLGRYGKRKASTTSKKV